MDYEKITKRNELRILNDFVTKPIYLDFDRNPTTEDSKNLAYCGGCGGDFVEVGCSCGMVDSRKLRQEIIKWIKSGDMSSSEAVHIWMKFVPDSGEIIPSMIAIKKFLIFWFKISEEELK